MRRTRGLIQDKEAGCRCVLVEISIAAALMQLVVENY